MRRITTILLTLAASLTICAQEGRFGYINFSETIKMLPEYAKAQESVRQLQNEYAKEVERSETEFYRQYTEYLHGQDLLSATIVMKRQKELQQLYDNSMTFKKNFRDSLNVERKRLLEPLELKVMKSVNKIGKKLRLDYVIDLSAHTYLYIDDEKGVDISHDVYKDLGIEYQPKKGDENPQQRISSTK